MYTEEGLAVTTASTETIAAIDRFIDQSLCYGRDAETAILKAIAADPACAIAHAYAAAYYLSQETAIDKQRAVPHLQAAQQHAFAATAREQLYIAAIAAWSEQAIPQAIALHETIAEQFPRDLLSVQQGQYHYFYQGDKARLLAIAQRVLPANPDSHYLYGMIAFGLEQCHRLNEAEALARRAIELNRHDPWAHHAIAHVMETQQRFEEGIAWMEKFSDTWDTCNSMLYTHNWWHIALYYLAKAEFQTVLHLYDAHVWGRACPTSPKDQVGAIALLLRLELHGVNVGDRWDNLAPALSARLHEHALPFQDLHYVYALARADRREWLMDMMQSLHSHARTVHPHWRQAWTEVAIPAARGLIAHAQGERTQAIAYLKPVLSRLWSIGGSHAQRQLFQQIYQDALQPPEPSRIRAITLAWRSSVA